jgi:Na+-driven multidrug efflux pump
VARLAAVITFAALSAFGLICFVFAPNIVGFFVPEDPAVIAEGALYIRIVAWSFGFIGVQFALMGVLRAAGEMVPAMTISLVSQWLLQLPAAYILAEHFRMGVDGLFWSSPIANVATAIIAVVWFARGTWKTRRLIVRPLVEREREEVEEQAQM